MTLPKPGRIWRILDVEANALLPERYTSQSAAKIEANRMWRAGKFVAVAPEDVELVLN